MSQLSRGFIHVRGYGNGELSSDEVLKLPPSRWYLTGLLLRLVTMYRRWMRSIRLAEDRTDLELVDRRGTRIKAVDGPDGGRILVFSGHAVGARCLLLPSLHLFTQQHLRSARLAASIPNREVLYVFAAGLEENLVEVRRLIQKGEWGEQKPIT